MWILVGALGLGSLAAVPSSRAQYPGQIAKKEKDAPALRAIAVLEWTGDLGKPKTSRLVPITVYDGEQLQDGGEYLARPEPLAVAGGVEYVLQKNGAHIGLFDIHSAGQEQGSWVGFGNWKPIPSLKPKAPDFTQKIDDDENSDRPVLHRKKGADHSGSDAGSAGPPPDPDRPTLHKKPADEDGGASAPAGSPGTASAPATPPAAPGGKPGGADTSSSSDPDRPQLKRGKAKTPSDEGYVESMPGATDPDRPRLLRGKSTGGVTDEATPTLVGLPAGMEQAVAVSDPRNRPEHPWNFSWTSPDDEQKMKEELEKEARKALGLETGEPAAPARKTASSGKTASAGRTRTAKTAPPAEPAPLADEEFRVFELAYGSGATMVLSAHTAGPPAEEKFVTLIAQPDLYGSLVVLFKNLTDGAHLDEKPRMRLVDAVDALADNRGELLFELRGKTERQFALYRVLRGTARELFITGGGASTPEAAN